MKTRAAASLILLFALVFLLSACSFDDIISGVSSAAASVDQDSEPPEQDGLADADPALRPFVEEVRQSIPDMERRMENRVRIKAEGRGGTLAYVYTYEIKLEDAQAEALAIAEQLEAEADVFRDILTMLRLAGVESPAVAVEYMDADGSMIYEEHFGG